MRRTTQHILFAHILTLGCIATGGAENRADTISHAILNHASPIPPLNEPAWKNPALKQWQWNSSLSHVGACFNHTKQSAPVNPQQGTGSQNWQFVAHSYMKHRTATLWGDASYTNGRIRHKQWCEAVDLELIYPYYPADERGGSMNMEQYAFSGGYADTAKQWAWGVSLGYIAGLYYRPVDPRPKDVTGNLLITAGTARTLGRYRLGLGLEFMKYKQSVSINFVSEMGNDKIYHTTGMGTHYVRFAGNGATTYYNGCRYGAALSLLPVSMKGFTATISANRFTFNTILSDLNKLPLCGAWHNDFSLHAGYITPNWGVTTTFNIYKRHGQENIFGDASGNIYPQIGSANTYADNAYTVSIKGAWQKKIGSCVHAHASAHARYSHRREVYFLPARQSLNNGTGGNLQIGISSLLPRGWIAIFSIAWGGTIPVSNALTMHEMSSPTSISELIDIEETRHRFASAYSNTCVTTLSLSRAITSRHAIQLSGEYGFTTFSGLGHQRTWHAALSFVF